MTKMRGKWNGFERKMNASAITCFLRYSLGRFFRRKSVPRALIDYTGWGTLHGTSDLEFARDPSTGPRALRLT